MRGTLLQGLQQLPALEGIRTWHGEQLVVNLQNKSFNNQAYW